VDERGKRTTYRLLVGKPEREIPLGSPRYGWMDSMKMDRTERELGAVDWIHLDQDTYSWRALLNAVMNLLVP
jgi:hypothetical protein